MASQVVEAFLKVRGEAAALTAMGKDADALSKKLGGATSVGGKFVAQMAVAAAPVAIVSAAVGGLVFGLASLATGAEKNRAELQKLGLITREQSAAIDESAAAVGGLHTAWKALGASIAGSPLVSGITDGFFTGLAASIHTAASVIRGEGVPSLQELAKVTGEVKSEFMDWGRTARSFSAAVDESLGKATGKVSALAAAAKELRESREEFRLWLAEQERAANAARLLTQAANSSESVNARRATRGTQLSAPIGGLDLSGLAGQEALLDDVANLHKRTATEIAGFWLTAAGQIMGALGGLFNKSEKAQKAWALVSIAVNTAAAIMQAAASAPPPANIAPIIAMGTLGAVQFAAAAAGTMAGAHGGGMGARYQDAGPPMSRREERMLRREAREDERDEAPGGGSRRSRSGGTTIYALDVRELARQLKKAGALGISAVPE